EPATQQRLIDLFHFALNEGGYLFLGRSETLGSRSGVFEPVSERWRLFRHAAGAARARAGQSLPVPAREPGGSNLPALKVPSTTSAADDPGASVRERLLHAYTPPAVLVNRRYKVLYFHGDT